MTRTPYRREPPRVAFLAAVLARALPDAAPYRIAGAVDAMIHAAKAHKRAGEHACSYPMTEAQAARIAERLDRLAAAAERAVYDAAVPVEPGTSLASLDGQGVVKWTRCSLDRPVTIRLTFGGDPRGPCGRLIVSDMPGDGFGEGFALYE